MNLLEETKECLQDHGKTLADILWCGSEEFGWFDVTLFIALADKEYDNGFGAAHVAVDLLIVGEDFWLSRSEYDGSESWCFHSLPITPNIKKDPTVILDGEAFWGDLKSMNKKL